MQTFSKLALLPTLWLIAMSTACISDEDFTTKRNSLDEDGDGCPFSNDCDDADSSRGDCLAEVPYDGVDNDCSTGSANIDEVDVDGDGVPGIPYEVWIENGGVEGSWPESVPTTEGIVDCRDVRPSDVELYGWSDWESEESDPEFTPATHELASDIFPGATDAIYDGVDSDCGGENDFDGDGDGYMPPAASLVNPSDSSSADFQTAFEAYTAEWGYSFEARYDDCFDIGDVGVSNTPASEINPGVSAEDDAWYDGIDQDCAGNNDFDQDGDGYIPAGYETEYSAFVELHYGTEDPPWGTLGLGDDCLDEDDANLSVAASGINPGATDVAYNGVDEDCSGNNDFDQDRDGYRAEGFSSDYDEYVADWIYTAVPATSDDAEDCDDTLASVYPGALEILDDGNVDSDCDGGKNSSVFSFGDGATWSSPSGPVALTTANDYLLTVLADGRNDDDNIGYTYVFDGTAAYTPVPSVQSNSFGPNLTPIAPAYDALAGDSRYFTAGSYSSENSDGQTTTFLYFTAYDESTLGSYDYVVRKFHADFHDDVYQDIDVINDGADRYWVFACGTKKLHFMSVVEDAGDFEREAFDVVDMNIVAGSNCFMSPAAADDEVASATVCAGSAGCTTYDLDRSAFSITEAASSPWSTFDFVSTTTNGDYLIASKSDAGIHLEDLFTGEIFSMYPSYQTVSSDAVTIGTMTYLAFIRDDAGERSLVLAFGDLSASPSSWKEVDLNTRLSQDERLEKVTISGDADRLIIGVTASGAAAGQDLVGWSFLGLQ